MAIPGCGKYSDSPDRGGDGGIPDPECRDGVCTGYMFMYRGCYNTPFMRQYASADIIMSDSDNRCKALMPNGWNPNKFSHDAVIVGYGMVDVFEYMVIK